MGRGSPRGSRAAVAPSDMAQSAVIVACERAGRCGEAMGADIAALEPGLCPEPGISLSRRALEAWSALEAELSAASWTEVDDARWRTLVREARNVASEAGLAVASKWLGCNSFPYGSAGSIDMIVSVYEAEVAERHDSVLTRVAGLRAWTAVIRFNRSWRVLVFTLLITFAHYAALTAAAMGHLSPHVPMAVLVVYALVCILLQSSLYILPVMAVIARRYDAWFFILNMWVTGLCGSALFTDGEMAATWVATFALLGSFSVFLDAHPFRRKLWQYFLPTTLLLVLLLCLAVLGELQLEKAPAVMILGKPVSVASRFYNALSVVCIYGMRWLWNALRHPNRLTLVGGYEVLSLAPAQAVNLLKREQAVTDSIRHKACYELHLSLAHAVLCLRDLHDQAEARRVLLAKLDQLLEQRSRPKGEGEGQGEGQGAGQGEGQGEGQDEQGQGGEQVAQQEQGHQQQQQQQHEHSARSDRPERAESVSARADQPDSAQLVRLLVPSFRPVMYDTLDNIAIQIGGPGLSEFCYAALRKPAVQHATWVSMATCFASVLALLSGAISSSTPTLLFAVATLLLYTLQVLIFSVAILRIACVRFDTFWALWSIAKASLTGALCLSEGALAWCVIHVIMSAFVFVDAKPTKKSGRWRERAFLFVVFIFYLLVFAGAWLDMFPILVEQRIDVWDPSGRGLSISSLNLFYSAIAMRAILTGRCFFCAMLYRENVYFLTGVRKVRLNSMQARKVLKKRTVVGGAN